MYTNFLYTISIANPDWTSVTDKLSRKIALMEEEKKNRKILVKVKFFHFIQLSLQFIFLFF
jgi:hypothetical protein